jgi:hypothetical protein
MLVLEGAAGIALGLFLLSAIGALLGEDGEAQGLLVLVVLGVIALWYFR